ncbi:MAG: EAL domain-containing protein [Mariprofundaceae bacterium]
MTLSRQLILTLLCLILILFGGMFGLNLKHVQNLLSRQMEAQTQNSADSLALSLKEYLAYNDIEGAKTFVDGFFNHGFYQKLSVTDARNKKTIIVRSHPRAINEVPDWFVEMIPLHAPVKKAEVLFYDSGHRQRHLVLLEARSSHAYEQLWLTTKKWFILSVLLIVTGTLLLIYLIRWQLSPLRAIEEQAIAISRREFSTNHQMPRARELGRVVLAMNSMSEKLKRFIDELTEKAEKLLRETRIDLLTGLMNRQTFMDSLHAVMNENGVIGIIHVHNLGHINDMHGYPAGNELLRALAEVLRKEKELYAEAFTGRISGSDFAIVTPGLSMKEFLNIYKQLESRLASLSVPEGKENPKIIAGIASYDQKQGMSKILAKANHALAMAMHQEKTAVYLGDDREPLPISSTDWGGLIDNIIRDGSIKLTSQDVKDPEGKILFRCLLARPELPGEKDVHTASFIAMAERLGRASEFDQLVIGKIFQHASSHSDSFSWAIKLLASSWYDEGFQEWLLGLLKQYSSVSGNMFITCTEASLIRDVAASKKHIDCIRQSGGRIIMDHFGGELNSFTALRQLKPDYIKLDGSYIRDIIENDDHKMFLGIVTNIAHGLDIGVITEHVESDDIKSMLKQIDIDAFQGYAISQVELLES